MKNQNTTIAGIAAIVAAVAGAVSSIMQGHSIDVGMITALISAISAGIGLIRAADAKPTPPTP